MSSSPFSSLSLDSLIVLHNALSDYSSRLREDDNGVVRAKKKFKAEASPRRQQNVLDADSLLADVKAAITQKPT
jgi:hypothetical protein